jgi:hypothetical protein
MKVVGALALASVVSLARPARACGCFAPPSTLENVVQAGERILFAVRNGTVIAHVQIQYAGQAQNFGWLLPLPSVPTLKLGTDELFTELNRTTVPTYSATTVFACARQASASPLFGCASPTFARSTEGQSQDAGTSSVVVTRSSIGPYDYAVLRADDRTAMLTWLNDNRYFVPTGTDAAVDPYIRPGAYFLALKLRAGADTKDITPVVLEYQSAYPMIPLILTSVGAEPNMGIQVWLLGNARGVPRNFHHVVLNDAQLDWANGVPNYARAVTRAVAEAPEKHAFVTEYAGSSAPMKDVLAPPSRFGLEATFAATTRPEDFVRLLYGADFARDGQLPSGVVRVLESQLPVPAALAGTSPDRFYSNADSYFGDYRRASPSAFENYPTFDAPTLARELFSKFVEPVREANALFTEFPKLTRLFTTLSPEDMTADPVFGFNPDLPDVSRVHAGTLTVRCDGPDITTEQGWVTPQRPNEVTPELTEVPAALRVESLGEEGAPMVVVDNTELIRSKLKRAEDFTANGEPKQGCSVVDPLSLGLIALMPGLRRRRR